MRKCVSTVKRIYFGTEVSFILRSVFAWGNVVTAEGETDMATAAQIKALNIIKTAYDQAVNPIPKINHALRSRLFALGYVETVAGRWVLTEAGREVAA